jgi:dTDP-4-dehydrorhamnose reductase
MKVFITGHKGYVGSELIKRGFLPLDCDITNWSAVERAVQTQRPSLLIHLAGKSNVNWCEDKANQEEVIKTNVRGTYNVFENLARMRIPSVFLSTDQIWGGGMLEQHKEHSRLTPAVNYYAMSKVSAEFVARSFEANIIRTSYLFDSKRLAPHLKEDTLPVFIRRSFMNLCDFCDALERYCKNYYAMPKVLHLSGSEIVSWYGFMKEVRGGEIKPRFFEAPSPAKRPWFGGLNTSLAQSLGFRALSYRDGIARMKNGS